jgi:hypothetical protein
MQMSKAKNPPARRRPEDLLQDIARHERLLDLVVEGDLDVVLHELQHHGDRTFLEGIEDRLDGHTDVSLQWLEEVRAQGEHR